MREKTCIYCGDPADTEDHLEPVSRQTSRRRKGKMPGLGDTVPCCGECNSLLGAANAFTVKERAAVLVLAYARRDRRNPLQIVDRLRRLIHVAAGFPLDPEIAEMEARRRHRLAELAAERRAAQEAEEAEAAEREAARLAEASAAAELAGARKREAKALRDRRAEGRPLRQLIAKGRAAAREGDRAFREKEAAHVAAAESNRAAVAAYDQEMRRRGQAARNEAAAARGRPAGHA